MFAGHKHHMSVVAWLFHRRKLRVREYSTHVLGLSGVKYSAAFVLRKDKKSCIIPLSHRSSMRCSREDQEGAKKQEEQSESGVPMRCPPRNVNAIHRIQWSHWLGLLQDEFLWRKTVGQWVVVGWPGKAGEKWESSFLGKSCGWGVWNTLKKLLGEALHCKGSSTGEKHWRGDNKSRRPLEEGKETVMGKKAQDICSVKKNSANT